MLLNIHIGIQSLYVDWILIYLIARKLIFELITNLQKPRHKSKYYLTYEKYELSHLKIW